LAVYVEEDYPIELESLLTEDVWALILIQKEAKGFKGVVRSKVSMTPLREPREMEYETIVDSNQNINGKYDFFTTLWNSGKLFYVLKKYNFIQLIIHFNI
jgi:hypothetical protein